MKKYVYLSMTPESLISSMLAPQDFGDYLAVGAKKRTKGQAMFFEVDQEMLEPGYFPLHIIEKECIPQADGRPKRSKYLSTYRVLEHVPIKALKNLYITTEDGKTLELEKSQYDPQEATPLHLYQQLCPVSPRVASNLDPVAYGKFMTNPSNAVRFPKLVFVELRLGELATNPVSGYSTNLPYSNINHMRDCLIDLQSKESKPTKTIIRFYKGDILFQTIKNGFFVADQENTIFYKYPTLDELQRQHYSWWRSAYRVEPY
ncbi:MAG: hypothetical protein PHU97_08515 [Bacteroidales bacterium]|nr:hypothetical protein [Bacteroidales bacterium]